MNALMKKTGSLGVILEISPICFVLWFFFAGEGLEFNREDNLLEIKIVMVSNDYL